MATNSLRVLWNEPRPPRPPARVWRDWALLAVAVSTSLIEVALQPGAVEVHLSGPLKELPAAVSVALYRIAQEALTNARRHARNVTRVHIYVDR